MQAKTVELPDRVTTLYFSEGSDLLTAGSIQPSGTNTATDHVYDCSLSLNPITNCLVDGSVIKVREDRWPVDRKSDVAKVYQDTEDADKFAGCTFLQLQYLFSEHEGFSREANEIEVKSSLNDLVLKACAEMNYNNGSLPFADTKLGQCLKDYVLWCNGNVNAIERAGGWRFAGNDRDREEHKRAIAILMRQIEAEVEAKKSKRVEAMPFRWRAKI